MFLNRILVILSALTLQAFSGQFRLGSVMMPIYTHTDEDAKIQLVNVPFATGSSDPEWRFSAISKPFTPATDSSTWTPQDVNLASRYGIKVSGGYINKSLDVQVIIDATKAKVPETYPFSIAQVIDSVTTCVKMMFPAQPQGQPKLTIEILQPAAG